MNLPDGMAMPHTLKQWEAVLRAWVRKIPSIGLQGLASLIKEDVRYVEARLQLDSKLHHELLPIVRLGKLRVTDALSLCKLPPNEQVLLLPLALLDDATTLSTAINKLKLKHKQEHGVKRASVEPNHRDPSGSEDKGQRSSDGRLPPAPEG